MITTEEIAKKLGISRGTVSRALNNNPNVNEKTRKLILKEVENSGYIANEAARSLVMKKKIMIAVVIFSDPRFFWEQVIFGIKAIANEIIHFGATVDIFTTEILDEQEQVELLNSLPDKGYHGIVLAPNNSSLLMEHVDRTIEKGTPVLLFNSDIPSTNRLCYLGCDYTNAGSLAAEIMAKSMNETGKVVIISLKEQVSAIEQRITGFRNELLLYENISIDEICRFDRRAEGVYEFVVNLLSEKKDISGIYVSIGALDQVGKAVLDAGFKGKIKTVGYDLSQEIRDLIYDGVITSTIAHGPFNLGYLAVK